MSARLLRVTEITIAAGTIGALVLPPFGGDACEVALGVAVFAWLVRGIAAKQWEVPRVAAAAVFAIFAADLAFMSILGGSVSHAQYLPLRLAGFVVGAVVVRHPRFMTALAWTCVVMFVLCTFEAVIQRTTGVTLLQGRELDFGRVRLNFTHPNDVTLLVVLAPLVACIALEWAGWRRIVALASLAGVALIVLLSGSKTAILAAAAASAVPVFVLLRTRGLVIATAVGAVLVAGAFVLNVGHLGERLRDAMEPPYDARLVVWSVGTEMWKDDPIIGRGFGTYEDRYEETLETLSIPETWEIYRDPIVHPHGIFMAAFVEGGLLGLLVLLALFGVTGWTLVLARRRGAGLVAVGLAAAMSAFAVAGVSEFWLGRRWVLMTLCILVGMCAGLYDTTTESR